MRLIVEVPATVANLGPGFDAFGLAIDLANEVTLDTSVSGVTWEGEGASELPTDGSDLVSRTIRAVAPGAPAFGLIGRNAVPLERGLGSSAAAVVAGVLLGRALAGEPTDAASVLPIAAAIEGHPDNAAAAVHGGFTIVAGATVVRCDVAPEIAAAAGAARAALVPLALTQDPGLLATALEDRLHQDVRLAAVPAVRAVFDRLRGDGIPVCLAGSGPSLLAFEVAGRSVPDPGAGWRLLRSGVRAEGARLTRGA